MRRRMALSGFVAVLTLALVAAACGGNGDGESTSIRTGKGLAVAALSGQLDSQGTGGQRSAVPGLARTGGAESSTSDRSSDSGAGLGFKGVDYSPALQQGQTGITVQGYGSATADPDSAILEFYFSRNSGIKPVPEPVPSDSGSSSGSSGSTAPPIGATTPGQSQAGPITEEDLQPVIDAIAGAGVPRDKIELLGQPYYDPYFASATLRAEVGNVDSVDSVVQAAQNAASGLTDIYLTSTNVSYTVSDCTALEKAAMQVAVEDANTRGAAFAAALGVGLGDILGATHYSYAPYGGTACGGNFTGPYPMGGVAYAQGATGSVQVFANVSITYAIQ